MALETTGLLCTLIFLISSVFEVLSINNLYSSQHGLIGLLLLVLAIWASLEVALISRQERSQPVRVLRWLLVLQIGLITIRHWAHFSLQHRPDSPLDPPLTPPEISQAIGLLLINLLLFLAISRCLIDTFAAGERRRANQLQHQNRVLQQTQDELRKAQVHQQLLEQQQRAQLEQKLKTSLTAAAVVHEIKQPLSAILLNCRTACHWLEELPAGTIPESLLTSLQQLNGDSERVVVTMERMRMLLRNVETKHVPIDLNASVESSLLFLKNDLADAHVQPVLKGVGQPCALSADGAQLQIALVNMIRNALQAMEAQSAASRQLLVQLQQDDTGVELLVADNGPGFPPGYHNNTCWELLKSTKAGGMGLGLFIAQTAATNHHGRLRIGRSSLLGGAEVVIELPKGQKST